MIPITTVLYILLGILAFGILIFVHELGHFLCARWFAVPVNEFAIGMGPKLLSWKSKKYDTVYSLRAFPIGGYVSMVGEDEESDDENALSKKPVWQRFIITSAGAIMNLILGFLVMLIMVTFFVHTTTTTIHSFHEDATSVTQGLAVDDTILEINGTKVNVVNDIVYALVDSEGKPVTMTVERGGETVVLEDVTFPTEEEDGITYGRPDFYVYAAKKTVGSVLVESWNRSVSTVKMIWMSLVGILTGRFGFEQVSGPVGVIQAVGTAASGGAASLLNFFAMISLNLGIFNLLPIPALDGGRLVFLAIEGIRRKPINPKYEGYIHFGALVILMLLMLLVTVKDVLNLF